MAGPTPFNMVTWERAVLMSWVVESLEVDGSDERVADSLVVAALISVEVFFSIMAGRKGRLMPWVL